MTTPLMMLGPGGDYVTQYDVKGDGLIKTRASATAGHDRDAQSSGGSAAWGWLPGRGKKAAKTRKAAPVTDRYEHTEPTDDLPATYAMPGLSELHQQHAVLQAITNWMDGQQEEIDRLAAIQTVTEAELARPTQADAHDVRVIRWNGGTMSLPLPCHAFDQNADQNEQTETHAAATDEHAASVLAVTTQPERTADDGQPQPHAQADEDSYDDSRHPALQRLFADDARARRSFRRLKGNGLRTRRSADQKGLPDPGCQQGALFGAVA